jgi:hypothetical protein
MAALNEDMTADGEPLHRQRRNPVSPLLSPLKWAAKSVASLVDLDPAICVELCKIERAQMHVVALVLEEQATLCGSIQQVFTETLSRDPPIGLRRADRSYACKSVGKGQLSSPSFAS